MTILPPWCAGPFELIVHAESHLSNGEDFDRRIALISFDNAIEVAITTYLSLHPIQRDNRTYRREDTDRWLHDYHSRLEFLEQELVSRGLGWIIDKRYIIWAHDQRNEQYHGGTKGTPEKQVLSLIRSAALWIFSVLFNVDNIEQVLEEAIASALPSSSPEQNKDYNRAIDQIYGVIEVAGQVYYASELLYSIDQDAYRDIGAQLCDSMQVIEDMAEVDRND